MNQQWVFWWMIRCTLGGQTGPQVGPLINIVQWPMIMPLWTLWLPNQVETRNPFQWKWGDIFITTGPLEPWSSRVLPVGVRFNGCLTRKVLSNEERTSPTLCRGRANVLFALGKTHFRTPKQEQCWLLKQQNKCNKRVECWGWKLDARRSLRLFTFHYLITVVPRSQLPTPSLLRPPRYLDSLASLTPLPPCVRPNPAPSQFTS